MLDRISLNRCRAPQAAASGGYDHPTMAVTVNDRLIAEAARRLAAAAPGARVILFGSRARGEERSDSDLDLLEVRTSTLG